MEGKKWVAVIDSECEETYKGIDLEHSIKIDEVYNLYSTKMLGNLPEAPWWLGGSPQV